MPGSSGGNPAESLGPPSHDSLVLSLHIHFVLAPFPIRVGQDSKTGRRPPHVTPGGCDHGVGERREGRREGAARIRLMEARTPTPAAAAGSGSEGHGALRRNPSLRALRTQPGETRFRAERLQRRDEPPVGARGEPPAPLPSRAGKMSTYTCRLETPLNSSRTQTARALAASKPLKTVPGAEHLLNGSLPCGRTRAEAGRPRSPATGKLEASGQFPRSGAGLGPEAVARRARPSPPRPARNSQVPGDNGRGGRGGGGTRGARVPQEPPPGTGPAAGGGRAALGPQNKAHTAILRR